MQGGHVFFGAHGQLNCERVNSNGLHGGHLCASFWQGHCEDPSKEGGGSSSLLISILTGCLWIKIGDLVALNRKKKVRIRKKVRNFIRIILYLSKSRFILF